MLRLGGGNTCKPCGANRTGNRLARADIERSTFIPQCPEAFGCGVLVIIEVSQGRNRGVRQCFDLEETGFTLVLEPHDARQGGGDAGYSSIDAAVRPVAKDGAGSSRIISQKDIRDGRSAAEQRADSRALAALPEADSHEQKRAGDGVVENGVSCGINNLGHFAHGRTETFVPQCHVMNLAFLEGSPGATSTGRLYAAFCQLKSFAGRLIMF